MDFEQRLKQRREREVAKTDFWNFSRFADNFTQQGIKDKLFVTDNEYYTPLTEEEKQDIAEKTARREAMEQLQKDSGDLKKIDKFYRDGFYLQEERAIWDKMSFLEKTDALLTQRGKLNRLSDIEEERYKRIGQSSNTFRGNPLVNGHLIADSVMSTGQQFVDGTVSIGNFIADKVSSIGGSIANGVVGVWDFVSDNPITRIIGRIWNGSLNAYEGVTGIIGSLGKSMNVVYEYWYFFVLGIVAIMILLKKI